MVHLYPGTIDQYFAFCREVRARERHQREEYERSLTDPTLQCEHGRSLFWSCSECVEPQPEA